MTNVQPRDDCYENGRDGGSDNDYCCYNDYHYHMYQNNQNC